MSPERKEEHAQDLIARGAAEEDLPPGLKAIEAELALLCPRTDRLDRQRLIFLAGQQSVAPRVGPAKRAGRWGWPAAFSAMTAVAATLLVILLWQPETPVEVRFVRMPAEPAIDDNPAPGPGLAASSSDQRRIEPQPAPQGAPWELSRPESWLASIGLDWAEVSQRKQFGPEASYARLLDQALSNGLDWWVPPMPVETPPPAAPPVPYRELLKRMLDDQALSEPLPDGPASGSPFKPGANS